MQTRTHYRLSYTHTILSFLFFLFLTSATNAVTAEPATHAGRNTQPKLADVVRDPTDVPPPLANRAPTVVHVTLTAEEVVGELDPSAGATYRYWTFNGKVPGPMIRVRQGDTVEVTLRNHASSHMAHSIDLHAALGPGGGAALSQVIPGESKTFTFEATTPGLFVYHCGTPMIAEHMANGMYGLILVEPQGGLPHVDHEYYVMQGEIYTMAPKVKPGLQQFSAANLLKEDPEYFVFNGAVDALTTQHPMQAKVGDTVRVFFGDAGPDDASSVHVVGEIFTRVYELGSLISPPLAGIQTVAVPPGAAAILEFAAKVPGKFAMMDHAIARMAKGLTAIFDVTGPENAALMHSGPAGPQAGSQPATDWITGMTHADEAANLAPAGAAVNSATDNNYPSSTSGSTDTAGMQDHATSASAGREHGFVHQSPNPDSSAGTTLNGCLTLAPDGKAMLTLFQSTKIYRLEARPLLFSENANRFVHVSGHFGSVLAVEDPHLPGFVADTVDEIAPNCSTKISAAQIRKALAKPTQATHGIIGMSDMAFLPPTLVVNTGEKVVWRNSSEVIHNVVADPAKALYRVDVNLPSGANPFESALLQPGQSFAHVFEVPGIYRYVCTLHEGSGMKGVIIVRGPQVLRASK
jgi:copper-containing nitrite reductase